jgi:hypothetical protein
LFKKIDEIYRKIYVINADFSAIESNEQLLKDIDKLYTETVTISARPQPNKTQPCIMLVKNEFTTSEPFKINVYGKSFFDVRNIYLSASNESMFSYSSLYNPFSGIDKLKDKYPPFKGIVVPEFNLLNENYLDFTLPEYPTKEGYIDIIVENEAGYGVMTIDRKLPPVSAYPDAMGIECETCGMNGIYVSEKKDPVIFEYGYTEFLTSPSSDVDFDEYTNEVELSAGTDPNDPNSFPVSLFNVFNNI